MLTNWTRQPFSPLASQFRSRDEFCPQGPTFSSWPAATLTGISWRSLIRSNSSLRDVPDHAIRAPGAHGRYCDHLREAERWESGSPPEVVLSGKTDWARVHIFQPTGKRAGARQAADRWG